MSMHDIDNLDSPFTPLLAIKEASRCLLCHDAPCSQSCPAQTDPGKFIRSIYFRNFKGAAETIRENNALGAVCARVCPTEKLCQKNCSRGKIDSPIDIARLQRFITDFETSTAMQILKPGSKTHGSVAIIGSGPAGLQAAASLTTLGYEVTIYEKAPQPGGWLRYGIPAFRLPESVLEQEIARIKATGVQIICNAEIGEQLTLEKLKQHYRAVLLATGASYGSTLSMFDDNPHTELAVDFLKQIKTQPSASQIPASAVIIGGGDVAMDVATTLKRFGCPAVTCVARETLAGFPASKKELAHARTLNVSIIDGYTPVQVNGNQVTFRHVEQPHQLTLSAEKIILAIGQHARLDNFSSVNPQDGMVATQHYQTADEHVFAAGDIIAGDKTVVQAVKTGKEAALAIHHYLEGGAAC